MNFIPDDLWRDGSDANLSWNCGVEGPTNDEEIEMLCTRQIKNLMSLTLISAGTLMLLMGDECRRTQGGNNNSYPQNNEANWFDWRLCDINADLLRFIRQLISLRLSPAGLPVIERFSLAQYIASANFEWHGMDLGRADWTDDSHSLAFTMWNEDAGQLCYVAINSFWKKLQFELPATKTTRWHRVLDTSLPSPDDIANEGSEVRITGPGYLVNPRSVVVLSGGYYEPKV